MITFEQARERLVAAVRCTNTTEPCELSAVRQRVLAQDVIASIDVPPTDNSAMDGFLVNAADIDEVPKTLTISQRITAGDVPAPLAPGTAARIFTGGMLAEGADAVVMQENCEFDTGTVTIKQKPEKSENVRPRGQDIAKGAVVIPKGKSLNAVDIGLAASIGCASLPVYAPLRVAILSTGNELQQVGTSLEAGKIYNSNLYMLAGMVEAAGFQAITHNIVADTLPQTIKALEQAAQNADVVITSGGVSVGEEDHVKAAVEELGELELWNVKMKPGKPVAFGKINHDEDIAIPFIGLPGNPVSSAVVFQMLAMPVLRVLSGELPEYALQYPKSSIVIADFDKKATTRDEFIRVRILENDELAIPRVERFNNLSSSVLSSLSWADGLVMHKADSEINKGDQLPFYPLREGLL